MLLRVPAQCQPSLTWGFSKGGFGLPEFWPLEVLMLECASGKCCQKLSSARQTGDNHQSANNCLLLYYSFISGKKERFTWHLYRVSASKAGVPIPVTLPPLWSLCGCVSWGSVVAWSPPGVCNSVKTALTLQLAGPPSTLKLVSPPSPRCPPPRPHPALSGLISLLVTPPASTFCTLSSDGKWKIPSTLVLPSWLQGLIQGSPWIEC